VKPELFIPLNWRPQMRDIAHALRDNPTDDLNIVAQAQGLASIIRSTRRVAVLLSDDSRSRPVEWAARSGRAPHTVRVWWNTAEDISAFISSGSGVGETHITFFDDVRADVVTPTGTSVVSIPYAFAPPERRKPTARDKRIYYPAEVDISDACFSGSLPPKAIAGVSDRTWELAHATVEGDVLLLDADDTLRASLEAVGHGKARRVALWALRNRVRFLLVDGLARAFPGRVDLRGSDWARLGFAAEPTRFPRWRRLSQYLDPRVAIDLGSKSTHSWLYPRTADIVAAGGGLVQFASGVAEESVLPGLDRRRGRTLAELTAAVDRMMTLTDDEAIEENLRLKRGYEALRNEVAQSLRSVIAAETP
jgi:hypothetical protein